MKYSFRSHVEFNQIYLAPFHWLAYVSFSIMIHFLVHLILPVVSKEEIFLKKELLREQLKWNNRILSFVDCPLPQGQKDLLIKQN